MLKVLIMGSAKRGYSRGWKLEDVTILTLGYSLGSMVHVGCGQGGNKIVCRCTAGKLNDVTVV